LVSACAEDKGLVLEQKKAAEKSKSNQKTAIPKLLDQIFMELWKVLRPRLEMMQLLPVPEKTGERVPLAAE
jgi:hypothetical protein